ncbi:hypothetical protein [Ketobacter alkanivorans]|uniref:Yip1 domain-containing protein n=1 Tax=Ketobacter alkanivorans TaxID=1917421 RepID=A0A2K9LQT1_9GAMM|nr:hypothetical protein [Ketobacter alkanivorans]AUM13835.1 hypothetical protein Kalk_15990 [Ketobacter alkanivorans]MCP5017510.1 hypothetical protein [Ketobacter sp.]
MKPLFVLFWQLCRFQKGPQDVPYSQALMVVLLLANVSLGLGSMLVLSADYLVEQAMGMLLALAVWMAMIWGILGFKGQKARFVQTWTACLGTDLLMSCLVLPLQVFIVTNPPVEGEGSIWRLVMLLVLIWDILIKARIYSVSMGLGRLQGNLLSISIWLLVFLLNFSFLPPEVMQQAEQQSSAGVDQAYSERQHNTSN